MTIAFEPSDGRPPPPVSADTWRPASAALHPEWATLRARLFSHMALMRACDTKPDSERVPRDGSFDGAAAIALAHATSSKSVNRTVSTNRKPGGVKDSIDVGMIRTGVRG